MPPQVSTPSPSGLGWSCPGGMHEGPGPRCSCSLSQLSVAGGRVSGRGQKALGGIRFLDSTRVSVLREVSEER